MRQKITKICKYCGVEFITYDDSMEFCNLGCEENFRNPPVKENTEDKEIRKCKLCGADFIVSKQNRVYYSSVCSKKAQGRKVVEVVKKCLKCGKEFEIDKKIGKRQKFCSKKCSDSHSHNSFDHKPIKCVVCGKDFEPRTSRVICCSDKCSADYKRKKNNEYMKAHNNHPLTLVPKDMLSAYNEKIKEQPAPYLAETNLINYIVEQENEIINIRNSNNMLKNMIDDNNRKSAWIEENVRRLKEIARISTNG